MKSCCCSGVHLWWGISEALSYAWNAWTARWRERGGLRYKGSDREEHYRSRERNKEKLAPPIKEGRLEREGDRKERSRGVRRKRGFRKMLEGKKERKRT